MSDSASTRSISDEAAMLIERAVRGEISIEERTRLDELIGADPVVAEELQRAKREEGAMNTAAMLLNERSDPDRMRNAIEQKLRLDRRGLRLVAGGFIVFVVIFSVIAAQERWPWGVLAPIALCLIWWLITEKRFRSFKRTLPQSDEQIVKEFRQHLSRSRNGIVVSRAAVLIILLGLILAVLDYVADAAYAKAVVVAVCGLVVLLCAWKTLFNRRYQQRYDQFLQGRLTLDELFEKRAGSTESDGE